MKKHDLSQMTVEEFADLVTPHLREEILEALRQLTQKTQEGKPVDYVKSEFNEEEME